MLGNSVLDPVLKDARFHLERGETFILYTDGYTEAVPPGSKEMFGVDRLRAVFGGDKMKRTLQDCAEAATTAVAAYTGGGELQDDQTLLLLRRR